MTDLVNKKILIIGGTSGFGLKTAELVSSLKAEVVLIGRDKTRLKDAINKINNQNVTGEAFDATDTEQLNYFLSNHDKFDHIISMLGGAMGGGFIESSFDEIHQAIDDKFFANLKIAKSVWQHIAEDGSLIFTSGSGGHPADASGAIIGNQAIETMVTGLAVELAPKIRVNAVSPTWTPTGLWRSLTDNDLQNNQAQMVSQIPLKRVSKLDEVAQAYVFLMQNNFVTGQTIRVDGGISVN